VFFDNKTELACERIARNYERCDSEIACI